MKINAKDLEGGKKQTLAPLTQHDEIKTKRQQQQEKSIKRVWMHVCQMEHLWKSFSTPNCV